MSLKKAAACVKKYHNFLITAHTNLEGDALGSELAFYHLLKKLGKNAVIFNDDDMPCEYLFLPEKSKIKRFKNNIKDLRFDCFVALDCSDLKRAGQVYRLNPDNKPILNIDHHISNTFFGAINWVDGHASSCSEMIFQLYKELKVALDRESALYLYVGILTDTGSFRHPNTSSLTHRIAAELLDYDLSAPKIYQQIYQTVLFTDMRLLIRLLPKIKLKAGGRIAWVELKSADLKHRKISFDLSEYILNFCRTIKGVEVAAIFRENLGEKGQIRVNLRSQGKIDVNKIAKFFGGGGHKTASGIRIKGNISRIRSKVLRKIEETLINL